MKRIIYTLVIGASLSLPLIFLPAASRAQTYEGDTRQDAVQEWFKARDVNGRREWMERGRDPRTERWGRRPAQLGSQGQGNSVPLNEGQVFLIIAGLGLGAKMLYDRRRNAARNMI